MTEPRVKIGTHPRYLERQFSDIAPVDALFDLVDNAIDAVVRASEPSSIEDLQGQKIEVVVERDRIRVADTGIGASLKELTGSVFRIGSPDRTENSIGAFGVGLNRAVYRLGKLLSFSTTARGGQKYVLHAATPSLLEDGILPLEVLPVGLGDSWVTEVEIEELQVDTTIAFRNIADENRSNLHTQLGVRYGRFIAKGLAMTLNGQQVDNRLPEFRTTNTPIAHRTRQETLTSGVVADIRIGLHETFRFTHEAGYHKPTNDALSPQFGWYILCNGRVVDGPVWDVLADRKWHTEYNGVIGYLELVGSASKLPWNSAKTGINMSSVVFDEVKPLIQSLNKKFLSDRKAIQKARKEGRAVPVFNNASTTTPVTQSDSSKATSSSGNRSCEQRAGTESSSADSAQRSTQHPKPVPHPSGYDVHSLLNLNLNTVLKDRLGELSRLNPSDHATVAVLAMRSILEIALKIYYNDSPTDPNCKLSFLTNKAKRDFADKADMKLMLDQLTNRIPVPGSLEWFNIVTHSRRILVSAADSVEVWRKILPLLETLLQFSTTDSADCN